MAEILMKLTGSAELTTGSTMFFGGIAGMVLVVVLAVILGLVYSRSGKKIKSRLENFYRDNTRN